MQRFYEWLRAIFNEKINIFVKGFCGGGILSGIFLFGGTLHDVAFPLLAYSLKLLAIGVSGMISGCATVLGNDLAKWIKTKWERATKKRAQNRKKKAA